MNCPVLELTEELIRRESVTPNDAGCLNVLGARLERLGFQLERIDRQGVSNLWATYGNQGPMVCFAGHTDVVPTGNLDEWTSDPFTPTTTSEGYLRGRGAADMKSSLAAWLLPAKNSSKGTRNQPDELAFC